MQGVRGSNPLSSTPGQRPSPPSTAPESRPSRSRYAATASACPRRSPGNAEQLKANEPKRVDLYKAVAAVTRAFGNLANEMSAAGYSDAEAEAIRAEVAHYAAVRDEVKLGAGEDVDFKQYEAGMRFLLDTYIQAEASEVVADFKDTGLLQLIMEQGVGALDKLPAGIKKDPEAVAETITNNMRKVIIDERAMNPKYYDKMSQLLDALIEQQRQGAIDYKQYLQRLIAQAQQLGKRESDTVYPAWADNGARRALIDFGLPSDDVAIAVGGCPGLRRSCGGGPRLMPAVW
jgi:type I restriction enzyme R subunit